MYSRDNIDVSIWNNITIEFVQHLKVTDNQRIIFSGKFGQGKTTFINEFFKPDNQANLFGNESQYNVIHLYPVNYSVSSNEDIFKYIKHDIIFELLNSDSDIQDYIIKYLETLPKYIGKNIHKVLAAFVGMIPQVGKDVVESFDRFDKIKDEYLKYHDTQEKQNNEKALLLDFIESVRNIEGSIYEDSVIIKLIEKILARKKEKFKENVLVIDDLDRIDPEHIFRILNVFSAHFDYRNGQNKFGFDKVILVCDIKNIRSIFKAKFGVSTDFNGYIDKFYSKRIFDFNNWDRIRKYILHLIENASWSVQEGGEVIDFKLKNSRKNVGFLFEILSMLIENNQVQLRNVNSLKNSSFRYRTYININTTVLQANEIRILQFIDILIQLKGNPTNLKDAILECGARYNFKEDISTYILEMLNILTIHETIYHTEINIDYIINGKQIRYSKAGDKASYLDIQQPNRKFTKEDFIYLFCKVIDLYETATDAH